MPHSSARGATVLLCGVVSLLSCSKKVSSATPSSIDAAQRVETEPVVAPLTQDQTLVMVSQALRRGGLLTRPDRCYAFDFDAGQGQPVYIVDVRENHVHQQCGGDPATQPHLFTVHVDKATRAISQDAQTPNNFQRLTP